MKEQWKVEAEQTAKELAAILAKSKIDMMTPIVEADTESEDKA